jgi:hypothetical protein
LLRELLGILSHPYLAQSSKSIFVSDNEKFWLGYYPGQKVISIDQKLSRKLVSFKQGRIHLASEDSLRLAKSGNQVRK